MRRGSGLILSLSKDEAGRTDLERTLELKAMAKAAFLGLGVMGSPMARHLKARGHEIVLSEQTSGLQGVQRNAGGWFGAADPRREGVARGE